MRLGLPSSSGRSGAAATASLRKSRTASECTKALLRAQPERGLTRVVTDVEHEKAWQAEKDVTVQCPKSPSQHLCATTLHPTVPLARTPACTIMGYI